MAMGKKKSDTLSKDDVLHTAKLSKLKLTPSEVDKFASQLSGVVDYINELSEVDTHGVDPTSQTTGLENVDRDDELIPTRDLSVGDALSGTDETHNGYFVVPMVLEERTV